MTSLSGEKLGLARRYRPSTFAELTGQRHVSAVLRRAVLNNSLPQQLLFSGGSGLGKTTVARICAAAILCETPLEDRVEGDACKTCRSCLDISDPGRSHPDVIEFDAASNGGKDEIREIANRALLSPMRSKHKIYVIDEAHGLSGPGGQAFLKLLEEPPPHVIFMLATTDPQKMLKTNRGRCTEFELLRPSDEEIIKNLERVALGESWRLSQKTAHAVLQATNSDLGVRGTLMTLEKLAGLLSVHIEPTDKDLAELLGVAPVEEVKSLTSSILQNDRFQALETLETLRKRVSDGMIRTALLEWAREEFLKSDDASFEMSLLRYETLAKAPPGEVWTECTVARLSSPSLVVSPESIRAQVKEAEGLLALLEEKTKLVKEMLASPTSFYEKDLQKEPVAVEPVAVESALSKSTASGPAGKEKVKGGPVSPGPLKNRLIPKAPEPRKPPESSPQASTQGDAEDTASRDAASVGDVLPKDFSPEVLKSDKAPKASVPSKMSVNKAQEDFRTLGPKDSPKKKVLADASSVLGARFLSALASRSQLTAAMVRSCTLQIDDDSILITASKPILLRLSDPAAVSDIKQAAQALRRTVRVVEG